VVPQARGKRGETNVQFSPAQLLHHYWLENDPSGLVF
jgi:hypothetical protein